MKCTKPVLSLVGAFLLATVVGYPSGAVRADEPPSIASRSLPQFTGISEWINSRPLTPQALRGRVTLVEFWTLDCINCKHTLPHLVQWDKQFRSAGLTIIGVHTPELAFERDVNNIKRSIEQNGIRYPVAVDPAYKTWQAYGNNAWPHIYLADRHGKIRYEVVGEGAYEQTEAKIRQLLQEK